MTELKYKLPSVVFPKVLSDNYEVFDQTFDQWVLAAKASGGEEEATKNNVKSYLKILPLYLDDRLQHAWKEEEAALLGKEHPTWNDVKQALAERAKVAVEEAIAQDAFYKRDQGPLEKVRDYYYALKDIMRQLKMDDSKGSDAMLRNRLLAGMKGELRATVYRMGDYNKTAEDALKAAEREETAIKLAGLGKSSTTYIATALKKVEDKVDDKTEWRRAVDGTVAEFKRVQDSQLAANCLFVEQVKDIQKEFANLREGVDKVCAVAGAPAEDRARRLGLKCFNCGKIGHVAKDCRSKKPVNADNQRQQGGQQPYNANSQRRDNQFQTPGNNQRRDYPQGNSNLGNSGPECWVCHKRGHVSRYCPDNQPVTVANLTTVLGQMGWSSDQSKSAASIAYMPLSNQTYQGNEVGTGL